jgi:hypothetical protein
MAQVINDTHKGRKINYVCLGANAGHHIYVYAAAAVKLSRVVLNVTLIVSSNVQKSINPT